MMIVVQVLGMLRRETENLENWSDVSRVHLMHHFMSESIDAVLYRGSL